MPHTSTHESPHLPVSTKAEQTALSAPDIHGLYIMGTLRYTQKLQHLTLEIEKCKTQIEMQIQNNAAQEQQHADLQSEQDLEERLLERVHRAHLQKLDELITLEREYRQHLEAGEYQKIRTKKQDELQHTQEEIETLEHALLHRELERLNVLEKLTPKRATLTALQETLLSLEQDKSYLERTALQQIHQDAQSMLPQASTQETTDTEILD